MAERSPPARLPASPPPRLSASRSSRLVDPASIGRIDIVVSLDRALEPIEPSLIASRKKGIVIRRAIYDVYDGYDDYDGKNERLMKIIKLPDGARGNLSRCLVVIPSRIYSDILANILDRNVTGHVTAPSVPVAPCCLRANRS